VTIPKIPHIVISKAGIGGPLPAQDPEGNLIREADDGLFIDRSGSIHAPDKLIVIENNSGDARKGHQPGAKRID
jgi:hypothetical protein